MTDAAAAERERVGEPLPGGGSLSVAEVSELSSQIINRIETVIDGKREAIRTALTVLLAEGHLLIEDVPGVGKTMLARALAASVDGTVSRIQFTPDLLPSDVTGVAVFDQRESRFEFKPGPVFAHIVIGDEINRASPKTQSALLECMAERQVTADGTTYELARPFTVFATQNPVEMEGTYPLPEAQRDRFTARLSIGYPDAEAEMVMLTSRDEGDPLSAIEPVVTLAELVSMIDASHRVFASPSVKAYAVALATATRDHPELRLGASPRATLQLLTAARARAAVEGHEFVLPDHIAALADSVFAHRLVPVPRLGERSSDTASALREIVAEIVASTPVPNLR
ncbi:AAA family ATPase [Paramicrobacterium agarici]|uniref:AAA family ATPase n=1 Tax=Paramicrobacterium agarici TaxID=630514 RepID=UPI00115498FB|nr:MoxR family ATPase [Microbacterium agarici]TQO21430.1 MoxR-like ATPase [Microbacterium agarici]